MEQVIKYHIDNTNKQFDEIKGSLHEINDRLDEVQKFKIEMLMSSRWVSLIISAACGFVTLTVTAILNYYIAIKINK